MIVIAGVKPGQSTLLPNCIHKGGEVFVAWLRPAFIKWLQPDFLKATIREVREAGPVTAVPIFPRCSHVKIGTHRATRFRRSLKDYLYKSGRNLATASKRLSAKPAAGPST